MTTPEAVVVHKMSGRMRIRVPSKRGDAGYFGSVKDTLSTLEGVEGVEVTPYTASVLVRGLATVEAVTDAAKSRGLFSLKVERAVKVTTFHDAVAERVGALDERIKTATGATFDLPGLAFAALMGAGIYQIARGNFAAPAWYTAFWYALGIFGKSSSKDSGGKNTGVAE
jgi:hypothetical protein